MPLSAVETNPVWDSMLLSLVEEGLHVHPHVHGLWQSSRSLQDWSVHRLASVVSSKQRPGTTGSNYLSPLKMKCLPFIMMFAIGPSP